MSNKKRPKALPFIRPDDITPIHPEQKLNGSVNPKPPGQNMKNTPKPPGPPGQKPPGPPSQKPPGPNTKNTPKPPGPPLSKPPGPIRDNTA